MRENIYITQVVRMFKLLIRRKLVYQIMHLLKFKNCEYVM